MIRFRNPGTEYSTQIQVIKELYKYLSKQISFTLDDMAVVIARSKLMTAYGYAGDQALELSNTDQESLNSAKMNAKMYAEVFRMLGWVTPFQEGKSYPLSFTFLGAHIALSTNDVSKLYEQCVLGINNPTQLTNNLSYIEKIRFFKCALRTLIDLDGIMYKHELCIGPMCIDDLDEKQYLNMLNHIKSIRGDETKLKQEFHKLAVSLGMKETPVDNCTRLPIALMKSCGWIESISTDSLYKKKMVCFKITQHGIDFYNEIKNMVDIRLDDFTVLDRNTQNSLIRLGMYQMLKNADYDISSVDEQIKIDLKVTKNILKGGIILFSPCQTISRQQVEEALEIKIGGLDTGNNRLKSFRSLATERKDSYIISDIKLIVPKRLDVSLFNENEDYEFLKMVDTLKNKGLNSNEIIEYLFEYYKTAKQTVFYPLISTLFKIMGLKCSFSRAGDNGSRWDAIIDDLERSIPIEIKSPTEELNISIKAIRQALENKIVLLSRKTFITNRETTSLAVGYLLPNERAEVNSLIQDIKSTYGYKIGVIDFKSLLTIAISILCDNKGIDTEKIFNLEGLSNASI